VPGSVASCPGSAFPKFRHFLPGAWRQSSPLAGRGLTASRNTARKGEGERLRSVARFRPATTPDPSAGPKSQPQLLWARRLGRMAARCLSARRLPGRLPRPPSGRYRPPTPLPCYPFLRRVRWRDVPRRPSQRSILRSAFRALRNRPKSGFLCRCCKRSSFSYGWVAANSSFVAAAGGVSPKRNICYKNDTRQRRKGQVT
jgi:hypothetical protein